MNCNAWNGKCENFHPSFMPSWCTKGQVYFCLRVKRKVGTLPVSGMHLLMSCKELWLWTKSILSTASYHYHHTTSVKYTISSGHFVVHSTSYLIGTEDSCLFPWGQSTWRAQLTTSCLDCLSLNCVLVSLSAWCVSWSVWAASNIYHHIHIFVW
jgi:hypothetical protein